MLLSFFDPFLCGFGGGREVQRVDLELNPYCIGLTGFSLWSSGTIGFVTAELRRSVDQLLTMQFLDL